MIVKGPRSMQLLDKNELEAAPLASIRRAKQLLFPLRFTQSSLNKCKEMIRIFHYICEGTNKSCAWCSVIRQDSCRTYGASYVFHPQRKTHPSKMEVNAPLIHGSIDLRLQILGSGRSCSRGLARQCVLGRFLSQVTQRQ